MGGVGIIGGGGGGGGWGVVLNIVISHKQVIMKNARWMPHQLKSIKK